MAHYRVYFMNPCNGHIERFLELERGDDESALAFVREQPAGQPMELWCGHRKVARVELDDHASRIVERWRRQREGSRAAAE